MLVVFVFSVTATAEIYTYLNTLALTTLFRSPSPAPRGARARLAHPVARERGTRRARQERNVSGESEGEGRLFCEKRRSEEHTSELQSLMRISYAVFCLKKKKLSHMSYYHIK